MNNKQLYEVVKDQSIRSSTYFMFKGHRAPTDNQIRLMNKHDICLDVDPAIRQLIIDLNEAGFKTFGSCSGHVENKRNGFVSFCTKNIDKKKIKSIFEKHKIFDSRFEPIRNQGLIDPWHEFLPINFISLGKFNKDLKTVIPKENYVQSLLTKSR